MPSISFDPAANYYDATRGYPAPVAEAIGAALCAAANLGVGSHVLELGIGTGRIAVPLLARGVNVAGVDISSRMLDRLQANLAAQRARDTGRTWGALEARVADTTALPYAAATFDAVIAVHVFHLVDGWERALDEALRVLRTDGVLIVGQDRHPQALAHEIQQRWIEIVHELGAEAAYVGAGFEPIVTALRDRGLEITTTTPVSWMTHTRPCDELDLIARRSLSRTWDIPEDIFVASIARLQAWMHLQYGAAFDQSVREVALFSLARAARTSAA
jgi:ubiquinone/menaquinone biosynthesis C-methylase UbiE